MSAPDPTTEIRATLLNGRFVPEAADPPLELASQLRPAWTIQVIRRGAAVLTAPAKHDLQ
jgi:hypothetical protein